MDLIVIVIIDFPKEGQALIPERQESKNNPFFAVGAVGHHVAAVRSPCRAERIERAQPGLKPGLQQLLGSRRLTDPDVDSEPTVCKRLRRAGHRQNFVHHISREKQQRADLQRI